MIANPHGSVPEVITEGLNGFIVESLEDCVDAIHRLGQIDRSACRAAFEERFTVERMTRDYVRIYESLVAEHKQEGPASVAVLASDIAKSPASELTALGQQPVGEN